MRSKRGEADRVREEDTCRQSDGARENDRQYKGRGPLATEATIAYVPNKHKSGWVLSTFA